MDYQILTGNISSLGETKTKGGKVTIKPAVIPQIVQGSFIATDKQIADVNPETGAFSVQIAQTARVKLDAVDGNGKTVANGLEIHITDDAAADISMYLESVPPEPLRNLYINAQLSAESAYESRLLSAESATTAGTAAATATESAGQASASAQSADSSAADAKNSADDARTLALQASSSALTATTAAVNADTSASQAAAALIDINNGLDSKAPLNSPEFTGTPTAPTANNNDNSTQVATTEFVKNSLDTRAPLNNPIFATDITVNDLILGKGAGSNNSDNNCFGVGALTSNDSGYSCIAIGSYALTSNTTGYKNIAIGSHAMDQAVSAHSGIAIGSYALSHGGSGANIAIGDNALSVCHNADNVAVGIDSAKFITGSNNVALGNSTLYNSVNAHYNVAIGKACLWSNTTGLYNTAVGHYAFQTNSTYSNSTCLGANSAVTGSNQVQVGDSATTTYVYGTVQNRSDARDKTDIEDTQLGLAFIQALRPRQFRWDMRDDYKPPMPSPLPPPPDPKTTTADELAAYEQARATWDSAMTAWQNACDLSTITHDGTKKRDRLHQGLIAQEVKSAMDALGVDFGGYQDHTVNSGQDVRSLGYNEFIAPLIKAVQELAAENAALHDRVTALENT